MSKYTPLTGFLTAQPTREVRMTFAEIEAVIGFPLPASKQYPAWWSNNASNNVMTRAWLAAGFQTESVDVAGERLVFRRSGEGARQAPPLERGAPQSAAEAEQRQGKGFFARLREELGGSVTIAPGVDITEPTGVIWDAQR